MQITTPACRSSQQQNRDMQIRIHAISAVYNLTRYTDKNMLVASSELIETLVRNIGRLVADDEEYVHVTQNKKEYKLNFQKAIPFALILSELLWNSRRHAFPDGLQGTINIQSDYNRKTGRAMISVSDTGIGLPDPEGFLQHGSWIDANAPDDGRTMGRFLIQALVSQLDGTSRVSVPDGGSGTCIEICFPLEKPGTALYN